MKKKAIASPIFNYIMVIVAGVIILSFFIGFASRQISTEELKTSTGLARTIDDALNIFAVTENTHKLIPDPKFPTTVDLNIECNQIKVSQGIPKKINKIIFSPSRLKGKQLQAWTLAWKLPFRVSNFYYLSNEKSRYILIYDSLSEQFVKNLDNEVIPKIFNLQTISENMLNIDNIKTETKGFDFVKFIFLTQKPTRLKEIKQKIPQAKIILISPEGTFQEPEKYGLITFYEETDKRTTYYELPMLYASIFSNNNNDYECSKDLAFKKLETLTNIYIKKSTFLETPSCIYSGIRSTLLKLPSLTKFQELYDTLSLLDQQNIRLMGDNCAALY